MPILRSLRLDRLAGWFARLARSQDTPPAPAETTPTRLVTQFPLEESTRFAQSLLDGGGLAAGQTVMIEGHRPMTVTVENEKVVLVPLAEPTELPEEAEPAGSARIEEPAESAGPAEHATRS